MNRKVMIIILVVVLLIIVGTVAFSWYSKYRKDNNVTVKKYQVYCDKAFFQADNDDFMYEPKSSVRLIFPTKDSDIKYSFHVVGVKSFDTDYDSDKGAYIIQFKMPKSYVSVYYRIDEPFD